MKNTATTLPIQIKLTGREMFNACTVGCSRQIENITAGYRDAHGATTDRGWQMHIEGAMGEMAAAKALGVYWSGITKFGELDIGGFEVRTTSYKSGCLIVNPHDDVDAKFLLVIGENGNYSVHGWLTGGEAKQEKWLESRRAGGLSYFVPQIELHKSLHLIDITTCEDREIRYT